MPTLFLNIAVVLFAFLAALLAVILASKSRRLKQFEKHQQVLVKSEEKSFEVLHQAIQKAQQLLGQAADQNSQLTNEAKVQVQKYEQNSEVQLKQVLEEARIDFDKQLKNLSFQIQNLSDQSTKASGQYQAYLNQLQSETQRLQQLSQETIKSEINKLFENFEQQLTHFLTQTEQESVRSIDLELRAARQLIDTYKQQQLQLIDENAIAVLERTLALVLTKKINLKDHLDLVYESLEQAKIEKFISEG